MKDALSWKFWQTSFEKMAYISMYLLEEESFTIIMVFKHLEKSAEPQIFACLADTLILAKPMHSAGIIRVSEW